METQKITIEVEEISKRSSRTEYLQWSHHMQDLRKTPF